MFLYNYKFSVLLAAGALCPLVAQSPQSPLSLPKSPPLTSGISVPASNVLPTGLMQTLDPLKPQVNMLLQRTDIQRELGLNARQIERLVTMLAGSDMQLMRLQTNIMVNDLDFLRQLPGRPMDVNKSNGLGGGVTPPDTVYVGVGLNLDDDDAHPQSEITSPSAIHIDPQTRKRVSGKIKEAHDNFERTQQQQIDTILTAPQAKRLRELELQWRGLFALLDKKVAERLPLTPEAHDTLDTAFNRYKVTLQDIGKTYVPQLKPLFQPNADNRENAAYVSVIERKRKTVRKARSRAEMDALVSLPIPVQLQWRDLTGKPFAFRLHDLPGDMGTPRE